MVLDICGFVFISVASMIVVVFFELSVVWLSMFFFVPGYAIWYFSFGLKVVAGFNNNSRCMGRGEFLGRDRVLEWLSVLFCIVLVFI